MFDPSIVRWRLVVGYGPYPSSVEVDCGCIASVALLVERGVRYSFSRLEILHGGEGGDVELGARTSKHIFVFAFGPFSLSLSLSLSLYICAKHHSSFISFIACVVPCIFHIAISCICLVVCVCLTCT